jgi:hypothetical protein
LSKVKYEKLKFLKRKYSDLIWYLNRLKKMRLAEISKRIIENLNTNYSRIKFHDSASCQYKRFARNDVVLTLHKMPSAPISENWKNYLIYNFEFDLTQPINWYFTAKDNNSGWPNCHYAGINYRQGNPYGDVRINWELNRLQFLPAMAVSDEKLAKRILTDWLENNLYLHGPSYLSSMEVALRWFSIYWAVCLFKQPLFNSLLRTITGLSVASGKFIERHLSTHSSAGNHLIVEAVGLFWIGKTLKGCKLGARWIPMAREILWSQITRQINPDGTNQEQSFWYLGFTLDAIFHYILFENRKNIPSQIWERIEKALEYVNDMTLPDGSYPDYGDRDDGFIFRPNGGYYESPFPGLLNIGAFFFNRTEWYSGNPYAQKRLNFWLGNKLPHNQVMHSSNKQYYSKEPKLKTYPQGGITLMQWGKGRLIFRHALLGLSNTYGHGHADALSIIFYWDNTPVLADLGSGQYNDDKTIRNFFRSTIAHNTVEVGGKNQSKILGPFLWDKSYDTKLEESGISPVFYAKASHNGYLKNFFTIHTRKMEWKRTHQLDIDDSFSGSFELPIRGAFHLGPCDRVYREKNFVETEFKNFKVTFVFPPDFSVEILYGSKDPFMGWRSTVYGKWEPIYSILFTTILQNERHYHISLNIS